MTPDAPILIVDSLRKSYRRRPVLRGVSFEARPGEAVAIIGPNGAGKSTLLGCLSGDRLPDDGSIRICGHDPFEDPRAVAECMGFVPEQPFLYEELTVAETLQFVAEIRGLDDGRGRSEIGRLVDSFGLVGAEQIPCRELSQGMARKVAIIAALLHRPRLLVLDEAFNGLDRSSAERLIAELDERRAEGSAVLLSSHDFALLATWCDRGLLLSFDDWVALDGEGWREWSSRQLRASEPPNLRDAR